MLFGLRKEHWPVDKLPGWSARTGVTFNNVKVADSGVVDGIDKGLGIFAEEDIPVSDGFTVLMQVNRDLILSMEKVNEYAKSDEHLKEVLDALGDFAQTPKGAIMTFLFVNLTYASDNVADEEKIPNQWTDYLRFLPQTSTLPTFYTMEEREMAQGTSLDLALCDKFAKLEGQFANLISSTRDIEWCQRVWWGPTGRAVLDDWLLVDAMYRTRALDLPGTGHCMVPCIDMANHAAGDETVALFETDNEGNAVLLLREGKELKKGDEITITYGDEKGACEMIFSYGVLPPNMNEPKSVFLNLEMMPDDPMALAKNACCKVPPCMRLFRDPTTGKPNWESDYVWWVCVNEEDGLEIKVTQIGEEEKEVKVVFKEEDVEPTTILGSLLKKEKMWPVFQLRAVVIIQNRLTQQVAELEEMDVNKHEWQEMVGNGRQRKDVHQALWRLREMERELAMEAIEDLQEQKCELAEQETVKTYLKAQQSQG